MLQKTIAEEAKLVQKLATGIRSRWHYVNDIYKVYVDHKTSPISFFLKTVYVKTQGGVRYSNQKKLQASGLFGFDA